MQSQFTQQNIGKFVNISKSNKAKVVDKGETKTGTELLNPIITSATRKLEHSNTIVPKKCVKPDSRSPEEVQRPPLKRHNKVNTMVAPVTTTSTTTKADKQERDPLSNFAELEKRLLAGFASMIQ